MKTILIGHRGVGKSTLAMRHGPFVDLDAEIEGRTGKTISEIFLHEGEAAFRNYEIQVFQELLRTSKAEEWICLGAGFPLDSVEAELVQNKVRVLWVQRVTDGDGRIFLNRPRLLPEKSPLEEYREKYQNREIVYQKYSTQIYQMPEGDLNRSQVGLEAEKKILTQNLKSIGGMLTLTADYFKSEFCWQLALERLRGREITFEIRDDLLNEKNITTALTDLQGERVLMAFRKGYEPKTLKIAQSFLERISVFDWAIENPLAKEVHRFLEGLPKDKLIVYSNHGSNWEDWSAAGEIPPGYHLKASPMISCFSDLERLHAWWSKEPKSRSSLPRSSSGRWTWYRLMQKDKQLVNFWKEGEGSAPDQPSLFQWITSPSQSSNPGSFRFAAVLGSPVKHSFSPLEHLDYFSNQGLPFWAIEITLDEFNDAIAWLQRTGLRFAAVTSPLKLVTHTIVSSAVLSIASSKDGSAGVNTLLWKNGWIGTSTDEVGLEGLLRSAQIHKLPQEQIAVWGGGGVLGAVQTLLPNALFYSSRTGLCRDQTKSKGVKPLVLIWGAPRLPNATEKQSWPPSDWTPQVVVDLNYKEDSLGREYALMSRPEAYHSGLEMFYGQAKAQQEFWRGAEDAGK